MAILAFASYTMLLRPPKAQKELRQVLIVVFVLFYGTAVPNLFG